MGFEFVSSRLGGVCGVSAGFGLVGGVRCWMLKELGRMVGWSSYVVELLG